MIDDLDRYRSDVENGTRLAPCEMCRARPWRGFYGDTAAFAATHGMTYCCEKCIGEVLIEKCGKHIRASGDVELIEWLDGLARRTAGLP